MKFKAQQSQRHWIKATVWIKIQHERFDVTDMQVPRNTDHNAQASLFLNLVTQGHVWSFLIIRKIPKYLYPSLIIKNSALPQTSCKSHFSTGSCKWNQLGVQYSQYISSVLFKTSTCFGPLQIHHQEGQLYLCDTCYFVILYSWLSGIPDIQLYRITSTVCRINTVVPPDEGPGEIRNM
jgi:hypothetical protein